MCAKCLSVMLIANKEETAVKLRELLAVSHRREFNINRLDSDQLSSAPDLKNAMAASHFPASNKCHVILIDDTTGGTNLNDWLLKIATNRPLVPVVLLSHQERNSLEENNLPPGVFDQLSWQEISAPLLERVLIYATRFRLANDALKESPRQAKQAAEQKPQSEQSEPENNQLVQELKKAQQVTERAALEARQAARDARTAATRLEAIINSLTDAVFVYDHEGKVQLANSFAIAILGFDPIHMPRTTLLRRIRVTRRDGTPVGSDEMPFNRAEKGELVFHDPITLINPRGRSYNLLSSALPFYIGREFNGVVVVWTDVTRLERLQEEIRQKSHDLQTEQIEHRTQVEVQRQLIRHREMERIQIARDLHDTVLQDLIAFNFALVEAMEMNSKIERLAKLRRLQESLTKEIRDLRAYCNDLRPPVLAPFGLEKAIRSHLDSLKDRHPELIIESEMMHDGKRLSEEVRMALFRVYQELVNNVIRHSQATTLRIDLQIDEELLTLKITDNGIGFSIPSDWVETARHGHFGIVGARERMESIGGELVIDTQPGSGSRITVQLPLLNQSI